MSGNGAIATSPRCDHTKAYFQYDPDTKQLELEITVRKSLQATSDTCRGSCFRHPSTQNPRDYRLREESPFQRARRFHAIPKRYLESNH